MISCFVAGMAGALGTRLSMTLYALFMGNLVRRAVASHAGKQPPQWFVCSARVALQREYH
jgi:hypothetical protein